MKTVIVSREQYKIVRTNYALCNASLKVTYGLMLSSGLKNPSSSSISDSSDISDSSSPVSAFSDFSLRRAPYDIYVSGRLQIWNCDEPLSLESRDTRNLRPKHPLNRSVRSRNMQQSNIRLPSSSPSRLRYLVSSSSSSSSPSTSSSSNTLRSTRPHHQSGYQSY